MARKKDEELEKPETDEKETEDEEEEDSEDEEEELQTEFDDDEEEAEEEEVEDDIEDFDPASKFKSDADDDDDDDRPSRGKGEVDLEAFGEKLFEKFDKRLARLEKPSKKSKSKSKDDDDDEDDEDTDLMTKSEFRAYMREQEERAEAKAEAKERARQAAAQKSRERDSAIKQTRESVVEYFETLYDGLEAKGFDVSEKSQADKIIKRNFELLKHKYLLAATHKGRDYITKAEFARMSQEHWRETKEMLSSTNKIKKGKAKPEEKKAKGSNNVSGKGNSVKKGVREVGTIEKNNKIIENKKKTGTLRPSDLLRNDDAIFGLKK